MPDMSNLRRPSNVTSPLSLQTVVAVLEGVVSGDVEFDVGGGGLSVCTATEALFILAMFFKVSALIFIVDLEDGFPVLRDRLYTQGFPA